MGSASIAAEGGRIAVLGLYNCGSTGIADMLHHLGAFMAPPFWEVSDEDADNNFYEPYALSWHLRAWWDEPRIVERVPRDVRVDYLRQWAVLQETLSSSRPIGAKHPLLCLCAEDLLEAWGPDTRFLWSWRPLEESIAGLRRRDWFGEDTAALQRKLWDALQRFDEAHPGRLFKLDWNEAKARPDWAAEQLASFAGIAADPGLLQLAAARLRPQASGKGLTQRLASVARKAIG
ncbi:MAG: hypothetical protein ACM3SO_08640 [Betaproteobacteria bacterium]